MGIPIEIYKQIRQKRLDTYGPAADCGNALHLSQHGQKVLEQQQRSVEAEELFPSGIRLTQGAVAFVRQYLEEYSQCKLTGTKLLSIWVASKLPSIASVPGGAAAIHTADRMKKEASMGEMLTHRRRNCILCQDTLSIPLNVSSAGWTGFVRFVSIRIPAPFLPLATQSRLVPK